MDRTMILSILAAAVLGFVGMLLLMPEPTDDGIIRLPWQIHQDTDGRTQVFGLTLGQTTLAQVREVFEEPGEVSLFKTADEPSRFAAEAYFERIYLQRLRANFVISLDADQTLLEGMYDRGLRISQLGGGGGKKIKLHPADADALANRPIRAISYLPKAKLDEALIEQRFGAPSSRLGEPKTGIVHWLYPERGVDLGRDRQGHVVIQYVNPADFGELMAPLAGLAPPRAD